MTAIKVLRYELQRHRAEPLVFGYALLLLALTERCSGSAAAVPARC